MRCANAFTFVFFLRHLGAHGPRVVDDEDDVDLGLLDLGHARRARGRRGVELFAGVDAGYGNLAAVAHDHGDVGVRARAAVADFGDPPRVALGAAATGDRRRDHEGEARTSTKRCESRHGTLR
jgi:hypothetical protein